MCFTTSLTKTKKELKKYRNTPPAKDLVYRPSFILDAFLHPKLYVIPQNSPNNYFPASWGLIPNYSIDDPGKFYKEAKYNTMNTRDDKLFSSSIWNNSILNNRCLIFADGFYEPHYYLNKEELKLLEKLNKKERLEAKAKLCKKANPYFCHIPNGPNIDDRELFTFAGLYTSDSEGKYYTSIITVDSNPFFTEIHNKKERMPLVLDRKYESGWLEEGQSEKIIKELVNVGFTTKSFDAYPVSNNLYKRSLLERDNPDILKRVEPIEPLTLF